MGRTSIELQGFRSYYCHLPSPAVSRCNPSTPDFGLSPGWMKAESFVSMASTVGNRTCEFTGDMRLREGPMMAVTAGVSLATNMAVDFVVAVAVYQALARWAKGNKYIGWIAGTDDK